MGTPITEAVAHDLPRPLPERPGLDAIVSYFTRSAPLYFFAHSMRGAMHMALNPDGTFHRRGYQAQSLIVERHIRTQGARRVLEIGCGRGFNLLNLARRNSDVALVGVDLTPLHVRAARAVARRRRNLDTLQQRNAFNPVQRDVHRRLAEFDGRRRSHRSRKIPHTDAKLQTLVDVGLGYIGLGQSATTLSGGGGTTNQTREGS